MILSKTFRGIYDKNLKAFIGCESFINDSRLKCTKPVISIYACQEEIIHREHVLSKYLGAPAMWTHSSPKLKFSAPRRERDGVRAKRQIDCSINVLKYYASFTESTFVTRWTQLGDQTHLSIIMTNIFFIYVMSFSNWST